MMFSEIYWIIASSCFAGNTIGILASAGVLVDYPNPEEYKPILLRHCRDSIIGTLFMLSGLFVTRVFG